MEPVCVHDEPLTKWCDLCEERCREFDYCCREHGWETSRGCYCGCHPNHPREVAQ